MANTSTNLLYHVIFSTKGRRRAIHDVLRRDLYAYIGGIVRREGGTLLEIGGMADHVHLVLRLKAHLALSAMVRVVKASSSRWLRRERGVPQFQWQRGYGAFTVSESMLPTVRAYVRRQAEHHQRFSYRDELLELLRRNGFDLDEKYLLG
jgi:REP element-mobilizing transposase RayT